MVFWFLISQWIDSSTNKSNFDDRREIVISKHFCVESVLCIDSKRVCLWKIFIEEIFITFWNICCALQQIWQATRGFDDAKCYSRDSTALQRVELVRTRSEYHESSYIPHRGDWEIQAWFMSCLANVMNIL